MVDIIKAGTEFLVNTQTANGQKFPTIAGLANGGFVVSWQDASGTLGDASGTSIKAQIYDAAGNRIGGEFLVNSQTANNQSAPAITGLANGGFVVSWQDQSGTLGDASAHSIKAQIFALNDNWTGTQGADIFNTTLAYNWRISAASGDDIITTLDGDDLINGGSGADWMNGGDGNDIYYVENGNDLVIEAAGQGQDKVFARIDFTLSNNVEELVLSGAARFGAGNGLDNVLQGSTGDDSLYGLAGNDRLSGNLGNDMLKGGAQNDTLFGGADNDRLYGEDGYDTLFGDDGDDLLTGGAGSDTLLGGAGKDRLTGGLGSDSFRFNSLQDSGIAPLGRDWILDFNRGEDIIDLTWVDGSYNDSFALVEAFSGAARQMVIRTTASDSIVQLDSDGDRIADMAFVVKGVTTLDASDFLL